MDLRTAVTTLPTPTARDWKNVGDPDKTAARMADRGRPLGEVVVNALLPTPAVNDMGAGKTVEEWDAWTARMKAEHGNGNGHGPSLSIEAQRLLPTPRAGDGEKGGPNQRGSSGDLMLPSAAVRLLPTPMVGSSSPAAHGQISGQYREQMAEALQNWGQYAAAIHRWETQTRPAPPPTEQDWEAWRASRARRFDHKARIGFRGSICRWTVPPPPRLSAAFSEWMMGLPDGWVTGTPGITRNEALKALGNGVVPQQAAAALVEMLTWESAA